MPRLPTTSTRPARPMVSPLSPHLPLPSQPTAASTKGQTPFHKDLHNREIVSVREIVMLCLCVQVQYCTHVHVIILLKISVAVYTEYSICINIHMYILSYVVCFVHSWMYNTHNLVVLNLC